MVKVHQLKPAKSGRLAPAPLETPTDLSRKAVKAVSAALNGLLADAFVLYFKTKNFHWHVSGPHFRDYHVLLDEQAAQIFATTDPLAERVRKLGGETLRSLSEVGRLSSVRESEEDFVPPLTMLRELVADNKAMAAAMRRGHKICDDNGDVASASLLEVYIDETEKRIWFLFEASRAAEETGH